MNKLKWIILPVLMIVSFVLISKPTYAYGNISSYDQLIDGVIVPVPGEEYNEFRLYNPYTQSYSTLHGFVVSLYDYQDASVLINVKNVSSARLLIYDVDLDNEYYDNFDLGVIDYIELGVVASRITTINFIRIVNGVPNIYKTYTFNFWDYDFRLMVFERADQQAYIDGQKDGYQSGLIDGSILGYDNGYDNGYDIGYDNGYDIGLSNGSEIMSNVQSLFEGVLSTIGNVFSTTIFPGVTIGTLFMIPISFAMFKWFLRLIR